MVTSAAVLLAAVLLLGGIIAVLGDRLGTKIGKARLRIFGLRPRQTATVVTVITGTLISASTLGILFAFSKPLRQGVFEIDEILKQKRIAEGELGSVSAERDRVAEELNRVTEEKSDVEQGLIQSQSLLTNTNEQLGDLREQLISLRRERQRISRERQSLIAQRQALLQEIPKLQASVQERDRELAQQNQELEQQDQELAQRDRTIERKEREIEQKNQSIREREQRLAEIEDQRRQLQDELSERDTALATLDKSIAERDRILRSRETQLVQLEQEINSLQNQLQRLAENYQEFRQGNVALVRGQVLAFGVVRILEPEAARGVIEQLLREANRAAIAATRPLSNEEVRDRIVQIPLNQVEQAIAQIDDGREYAIRILAAENYVEQETPVFVVVDVARNSVVFQEDEIIATIALEPSEITPQDLQNRLDVLFTAAQFRGQRAGILGDIQIEDGRIVTLTRFVEKILAEPDQYDQITAIAAQRTYVAGPLKLRLLAFKDGKMVLST